MRSGKIKPEAPDWEAAIAFILQTCDLLCQHCFLSIVPAPPAPPFKGERERERERKQVEQHNSNQGFKYSSYI